MGRLARAALRPRKPAWVNRLGYKPKPYFFSPAFMALTAAAFGPSSQL